MGDNLDDPEIMEMIEKIKYIYWTFIRWDDSIAFIFCTLQIDCIFFQQKNRKPFRGQFRQCHTVYGITNTVYDIPSTLTEENLEQ